MDKMIPQTVKVYRLDEEGCMDEDGFGGEKRWLVVRVLALSRGG